MEYVHGLLLGHCPYQVEDLLVRCDLAFQVIVLAFELERLCLRQPIGIHAFSLRMLTCLTGRTLTGTLHIPVSVTSFRNRKSVGRALVFLLRQGSHATFTALRLGTWIWIGISVCGLGAPDSEPG